MDRREFLKGCASFAALAAVRGFGITNLLFDNQIPQAQAARPQGPPPNNRDLLVLVFVRGGLDGLKVVPVRQEGFEKVIDVAEQLE